MPAVVVYVARGCHLCDDALDVVRAVQGELGFTLEVVDITGVPELEQRHRAHLPVVEIDGERAFRHHVSADELRARVAG